MDKYIRPFFNNDVIFLLLRILIVLCIILIDGCHIRAKVPIDQHNSYQDRKFQHSVSILVVCDVDKLLLNVVTGFPGSLHDARVKIF